MFWQYVLDSIREMCTLTGIIYLIGGSLIGLLLGSLPGLSGGTITVLLLPIMYKLNVVLAMALLIVIHVG